MEGAGGEQGLSLDGVDRQFRRVEADGIQKGMR